VRVRTLEDGHSPIVHYSFERDGVSYAFTMFAMSRDVQNGEPEGPLVNFIRVTMKNGGAQATRAILATGMRYDAPNNTGADHGDNRFTRPREGKVPGNYRQIGEQFSRIGFTRFAGSGFLRDGRLLYAFPDGLRARGFHAAWAL
jgi:hypothetical protein